MRATTEHQSIEIGHVYFGPGIERSPVATEANFLLASYAFDTLRCQRLEWKANSLNAKSRSAAERLGFTFEGLFRRAMVVRDGRTRDTAWFSMLAAEWGHLKPVFERWLGEANFDESGKQVESLRVLTAEALSKCAASLVKVD
jgi:RimJ/RimL family protein N-acetyltransferase